MDAFEATNYVIEEVKKTVTGKDDCIKKAFAASFAIW